MSAKPKDMFQHKAINSWNLLGLIGGPIFLVMVIKSVLTDLSSAEAVSSMIQLSVRLSVPGLYLAFAASSWHALFPSLFSRWLLRNRKIMGLGFTVAMAWQSLFILWLVFGHTAYYMKGYVLSDVVEGIVGYGLLIAMAVTTFRSGRSRLSPKLWKLLHKSGIYWLWAYVWSVYWWELFYYRDLIPLNYIYYWMGYVAWGLRMCAWTKKRLQQTAIQSPASAEIIDAQKEAIPTVARRLGPLLLGVAGVALVAIGFITNSFDSGWGVRTYDYVVALPIVGIINPYTPYFPFVPFYPMFVIMLGAYAIVKSRECTRGVLKGSGCNV